MVDVVGPMKESAYDRTLIVLTLLAPLLLFALSKWRASLDISYAALDEANSDFGERFIRSVSGWLTTNDEAGSRLIVIADRRCPCTRATMRSLATALAQSSRKDIRLFVHYLDDADLNRDPAWDSVLEEIPATPTLLAIEGKQLVYAGPVNSGNLCTTAVQTILGVTALQTPRARSIVNWLDRGCYCRPKSGTS
jgi:hypothetical protein